MLRAAVVIMTVITAQDQSFATSPHMCDRIEFDFKHPRQALAALKACVDLDETKLTSLQQRFLTSWAKYAVAASVGQAVQALADPEVREALIPEEDWSAVISKPAAARTNLLTSGPFRSTMLAEIIVVTMLTILTAGVGVWTLKLKSAALRGLPIGAQAARHRKNKLSSSGAEEEMLLQDCELDD